MDEDLSKYMNPEDPFALTRDMLKLVDKHAMLASLVFLIPGIWLYRHGKKNGNKRNKWIGIALLVYPMFVGGPIMSWGVGCGLCLYAYYKWDY